MRTGELSQRLGVSRTTVNTWSKRPELQPFLTPDARGLVGMHPNYAAPDIQVMNTVHHLRSVEKVTDWSVIAKRLDEGERYEEFPQSAITADTRTVPVALAEQSAKLLALTTERDLARQQIADLRAERQELKRTNSDLTTQLIELNRELGRLEGLVKGMNRSSIWDRFRGKDSQGKNRA